MLVVSGAVTVGYLIEHGLLMVLFQPAACRGSGHAGTAKALAEPLSPSYSYCNTTNEFTLATGHEGMSSQRHTAVNNMGTPQYSIRYKLLRFISSRSSPETGYIPASRIRDSLNP